MMRANYSYQKNQKELAKKKKRDEKLQRKLEKRNAQANADKKQPPIS